MESSIPTRGPRRPRERSCGVAKSWRKLLGNSPMEGEPSPRSGAYVRSSSGWVYADAFSGNSVKRITVNLVNWLLWFMN